jgi:hypothetical protein
MLEIIYLKKVYPTSSKARQADASSLADTESLGDQSADDLALRLSDFLWLELGDPDLMQEPPQYLETSQTLVRELFLPLPLTLREELLQKLKDILQDYQIG